MQNDLISRSALIEALREEDKKYSVSVPGFMIAMRVIDNQPTAYDVESVVADVKEENKCALNGMYRIHGNNFETTLLKKHNDKIVEIVRNGGKE